MIYYVGKYNIDVYFDNYLDENKKPYIMVIISEFKGNKEVSRKTFYYLDINNRFINYILPKLDEDTHENFIYIDYIFNHCRNNERL